MATCPPSEDPRRICINNRTPSCVPGFLLDENDPTRCLPNDSRWSDLKNRVNFRGPLSNWTNTIFREMLAPDISNEAPLAPKPFSILLDDEETITRAVADRLCSAACRQRDDDDEDRRVSQRDMYWERTTDLSDHISDRQRRVARGGLCCCAFGASNTTTGHALGFQGAAVCPCSRSRTVSNPEDATRQISIRWPWPRNGRCVQDDLVVCSPGWTGSRCEIDVRQGSCTLQGSCVGDEMCSLVSNGTLEAYLVMQFEYNTNAWFSVLTQPRTNALCTRTLLLREQGELLCKAKLLTYFSGKPCKDVAVCPPWFDLNRANDFNLPCLSNVSGRLVCEEGWTGTACDQPVL